MEMPIWPVYNPQFFSRSRIQSWYDEIATRECIPAGEIYTSDLPLLKWERSLIQLDHLLSSQGLLVQF